MYSKKNIFKWKLFLRFLFFFIISDLSFSKEISYGWKKYRVRSGDNLTKIARKFGTSIHQLQENNRLKSLNHISKGQILKISKINITPRSKCKDCIKKAPDFRYPVKKRKLIRSFYPWGDNKNYGALWLVSSRSKIRCSLGGRIAKVDYLRGYGKYIIVDHGYGWLSMYSGLSFLRHRTGEYVKKGESLGYTKGEKLFFSISYKGEPIDPIAILKRFNKFYEAS